MAARKKNEKNLAQTGQISEDTNIESNVVDPIIIDHCQIEITKDEGNLVVCETAYQAADHTEQFMAERSEGDMNTHTELADNQESADTVETKAVETEAVEPSIMLDSTLSIQNVVTLYEKLKKAYATYDAIELDASHVNSVDTATLQLFVALKKDAIKQKKEVDFFQPSPRFIESARLLDLLDILEITHV